MHEAIILYLLPVLLSKVNYNGNNANQDSRFLSLKIITDILM